MNAFCGMQINGSVFYSLAFCSGNYLSVFELSAGKKLKGLCSYAAALSSHQYGLNLGITIEVWTSSRKGTEW